MKFKRIDVDTVRCLISEDELEENGIGIEELLQNSKQCEEFIRMIIQKAEEEVDYKVSGGNISVQVSVLPNHMLALTLSENPDAGIKNMIENLKSAMAHLNQVKSNDNQEEMDVKEQEKEKKKPAKKDLSLIMKFNSLDETVGYIKGVVFPKKIKSSLYKLEGCYYLDLHAKNIKSVEEAKWLLSGCEFSYEMSVHKGSKAFIKEHGQCLIEKEAVEMLTKLK